MNSRKSVPTPVPQSPPAIMISPEVAVMRQTLITMEQALITMQQASEFKVLFFYLPDHNVFTLQYKSNSDLQQQIEELMKIVEEQVKIKIYDAIYNVKK